MRGVSEVSKVGGVRHLPDSDDEPSLRRDGDGYSVAESALVLAHVLWHISTDRKRKTSKRKHARMEMRRTHARSCRISHSALHPSPTQDCRRSPADRMKSVESG